MPCLRFQQHCCATRQTKPAVCYFFHKVLQVSNSKWRIFKGDREKTRNTFLYGYNVSLALENPSKIGSYFPLVNRRNKNSMHSANSYAHVCLVPDIPSNTPLAGWAQNGLGLFLILFITSMNESPACWKSQLAGWSRWAIWNSDAPS